MKHKGLVAMILFPVLFLGLAVFMVFTSVNSATSEIITSAAAYKESLDKQAGQVQDITWDLSLKEDSAVMNLYGEGWERSNLHGAVSGDTFTINAGDDSVSSSELTSIARLMVGNLHSHHFRYSQNGSKAKTYEDALKDKSKQNPSCVTFLKWVLVKAGAEPKNAPAFWWNGTLHNGSYIKNSKNFKVIYVNGKKTVKSANLQAGDIVGYYNYRGHNQPHIEMFGFWKDGKPHFYTWTENVRRKNLTTRTQSPSQKVGIIIRYVGSKPKENSTSTAIEKAMKSGASFNSGYGAVSATQVKRAYYVWNVLRKNGFTEQGAAGVLGNLMGEHGFNTDGENVIGIAQWTSEGRKSKLKAFAKARGKSYHDFETQVAFMVKEAKGSYKTTWDKTRKCSDVNKATQIWCDGYEAPSIPHMDRRQMAARGFFSLFTGSSAEVGGLDGSGAVDITGEVVKEQMGKDTVYYVKWSGTLGGVPIAGGAELTEKQYQTWKKDKTLKVSGDGQYGEGATWSNDAVGSGAQGAITWAKKIAADNSYGYSLGTGNAYPDTYCHICNPRRSKDYCCASFVTAALYHGWGLKYMKSHCKSGDTASVGSLASVLAKHGWKNVPISSANNYANLKAGDVIICRGGAHVELYIGNGKSVGANDDHDGRTGDSGGKEVYVKPLAWEAPSHALRFGGGQ